MKTGPRWTEAQEAALRESWDWSKLAAIAARLRRPLDGVYRKARELGLPCGVPPGHVYLKTAMVKLGFCPSALRRILKDADVPVMRAIPAPRARKGAQRRWVVDMAKARAAVDAWMLTETPTGAAKRLGVRRAELMQRLAEAGVKVAPVRKRCHVRIQTDVIDRAMNQPTKGP